MVLYLVTDSLLKKDLCLILLKTGWLYYPVVIIAVVLIVYSIISSINIEKGNKNV